MRFFRTNPSGGLSYHLLAGIRSRRAWRSYRQDLEKWGSRVAYRHESILIVGPSGGYTLPATFFTNLKDFGAFDIDPFARFFFRKVHRNAINRTRLRWWTRDFFAEAEACGWDRARFLERFQIPSDTLFVFTNLIGQLEFLRDDYADVQRRLAKFLRGAEWLSLHDRLASGLEWKDASPLESQSRAESSALADRFFARGEREVEEHDVDPFLEAADLTGARWAYFAWPLRRGWNHVVEGVFVSGVKNR